MSLTSYHWICFVEPVLDIGLGLGANGLLMSATKLQAYFIRKIIISLRNTSWTNQSVMLIIIQVPSCCQSSLWKARQSWPRICWPYFTATHFPHDPLLEPLHRHLRQPVGLESPCFMRAIHSTAASSCAVTIATDVCPINNINQY